MRRLSFLLLLITCFSFSVIAEDKPDEETYLNPAEAGADYGIQGEYQGVLDPDGDAIKFGLQVVALGDHKFDAVGYFGGLSGPTVVGTAAIGQSIVLSQKKASA